MADALQERAERLAEKVNEGYPENWKPEAGETLVGVFQRLESGRTSYGPAWIRNPCRSQDRHGAVCLAAPHCSPQPVQAARAGTGKLVAVKYEGKAVSSGGQQYDNWTVRVDRGDSAPDWSQVPGDDEPVPAPSRADFTTEGEDDIPF